MNTVVLEVHSLVRTPGATSPAAWHGRGDREARITFATPEQFWSVLSAQRWQLLKAMRGGGPMSVREAARRVDRDAMAVHADVMALLDAGVLNRTTERRIEFPFDAVRVEFMTEAA